MDRPSKIVYSYIGTVGKHGYKPHLSPWKGNDTTYRNADLEAGPFDYDYVHELSTEA